jgi:hypothetical protein
LFIVLMTTMTVTSMTTTMVKMTVVVEAAKAVGAEISVAIAPGPRAQRPRKSSTA